MAKKRKRGRPKLDIWTKFMRRVEKGAKKFFAPACKCK